MVGRDVPTAIVPPGARGHRFRRPPESRRSNAPAATDRPAPKRRARLSAARQRTLPDGENIGGEVSFWTSLHITRSPRLRGPAAWIASASAASFLLRLM